MVTLVALLFKHLVQFAAALSAYFTIIPVVTVVACCLVHVTVQFAVLVTCCTVPLVACSFPALATVQSWFWLLAFLLPWSLVCF